MKSNNRQGPSWRFRSGLKAIDTARCHQLARQLNLPYEIAAILFQRNLMTVEEASYYLYPQLNNLPQADTMKDMDKAIALVIDTFRKKIPVTIYGDYDVDGISATALIVEFLRFLDLEVTFYLPDRLVDGYGLKKKIIAELAASSEAPGLLITVDCGITAVQEVEYAKEKGFKVLIADHHEPQDILPDADAIINPKQNNCNFSCKDLAGVGVVFFLLMGIRRHLTNEGFWTKSTAPNLKKYLDLVALGTVADVVPLVGLNRIIVRAGLDVLSGRSRPGIWALCEQAKIGRRTIGAEDIAFRLGPRLNAAGRIDDPKLAVDLLLSKDIQVAIELARKLEDLNSKRKKLELQAIKSAQNQCVNQLKNGLKILVVYGNYHPGIIGIIASRLVARFACPVIVLTDERKNDLKQLVGSGRSIDGVNLFAVLAGSTDVLERYGGHAMAVGVTIKKDKLNEFTATINKIIATYDYEIKKRKIIEIDYQLTERNCFTDHFIKSLQCMEPFGEKNPEPVFMLNNVQLLNPVVIKNHLRFSLVHNGCSITGIAFGMGELIKMAARPVMLAFKLRHSSYKEKKRIELQAVLIAPSH